MPSLNIVKISKSAKYRWCLQYPAYTEHGRVRAGEEEWGTVGLRGGQGGCSLPLQWGRFAERMNNLGLSFLDEMSRVTMSQCGGGTTGLCCLFTLLCTLAGLGVASPSLRWGCWPRGSAGGTSAGTRRTAARRPCASADTRSSCGRSGPACSGSCSGRWARSAPATRTT